MGQLSGKTIYNDWYLTIAIVLIHLFGNLLVFKNIFIYYILSTTSSVYNVAGLQFCQVVSITSILEMRALRVLMTNIRQPRGKANTVYLSKCTWWCSLNTSPSQNYHRFQPKTVSSCHLVHLPGDWVDTTGRLAVQTFPKYHKAHARREREMKTDYCWLSTVFFKPMTLRNSAGSPSPITPHLYPLHSLIHCWERAQRTKCLLGGTAWRQGQELFLPATSLHNTRGNN